MTWADLDWPALDRLRENFLRGTAVTGPYWETNADLASYDFTYGERIGWKWDQVLRELRLRQWSPAPTSRTILDWGCGSGVAARHVISWFGAENFDALTVWDHSPLACDYAATVAETMFPSLRISQATPSLLVGTGPLGLLVISHVLNELPPPALAALRALIARADSVLWCDPGTHALSRHLGAIRDELSGTFRVIAPCTHLHACPMFTPGNERHWCHFFAPPPSEIFADSNWVKFGQHAGIDLRSLPYAFFALARARERGPLALRSDLAGETPALPLSRVIGRPEHFKPYARVLSCDADGLAELEVPKRADGSLYKQLDRTKAPLVYRWRREGRKILSGEPLVASAAAAAGASATLDSPGAL